MRLSAIAGLSGLALAFAPAARADTDKDIPRCFASFDKVLANEVFGAYPVRVPATSSPPAAPLVKQGRPHLYRTVIREEAKQGPNFAGHYTMMQIGCGAATVCPAIMDTKSGQVFFPPELKNASMLLMDTGDADIRALNYRLDSRLLVVIGVANDDLRNEGASYFVWRAGKLSLVRFVPKAKLCERN